MKISELIKALENVKTLNGDVDVFIKIETNDSFNTVLAKCVTEIGYDVNEITLS